MAGRLSIAVPSLLFLELLNVAARRWSWDAPAVRQLAIDLAGFKTAAFDRSATPPRQ